MRARELIEQQLPDTRRTRKALAEGTVIVLNSGPDEPGDLNTDAVKKLIYSMSKPSSPSPGTGAGAPPTSDSFSVEQGGKRWKFKVNRDTNGTITDLDVTQL